MSTGLWVNNDNLVLQYGTQKAMPDTGGDYQMPGEVREIEVYIDLISLTTSPVIQSFDTFFPAGTNVFIEQVDVIADLGATSGTTFSVGFGYPTSASTYSNVTRIVDGNSFTFSTPSVTAISNTALVNAMITADVATTGDKVVLNVGSTYAGGYIGNSPFNTTTAQNLVHPCYITALAAGTYTTGAVRVRVRYRQIGTITF